MRLSTPLLGKYRGKQFARAPLHAKRANKNYYKGTGGRTLGIHTSKGNYHVQEHKTLEIAAPDLTGFKLKPYVALHTPHVKVAPHDTRTQQVEEPVREE